MEVLEQVLGFSYILVFLIFTLDYIIKETGCKPEEIAIVGDRLYTDIAVADGSKVTSILVLSGESSREDVEKSDIKPDYIVKDLSEIIR